MQHVTISIPIAHPTVIDPVALCDALIDTVDTHYGIEGLHTLCELASDRLIETEGTK